MDPCRLFLTLLDQGDTIAQDAGQDTVTVAEAAQRLGITKEAVRKRISRGTLQADKDQDGTLRVSVPPSGTPSTPSTDALAAKDETIAILQEQLREEREARRRADTLLARALDQLPQLESSQQPPESHEDAAEQPAQPQNVYGHQNAAQNAYTPSQRRSWWSRLWTR